MADKTVSSSTGTVHIEIFGATYTVKAGADPGYVEELAAHVDAQMREVSKTAGAVDSVRVAVLAALNLADEVFRHRTERDDRSTVLATRAGELERLLDQVLASDRRLR